MNPLPLIEHGKLHIIMAQNSAAIMSSCSLSRSNIIDVWSTFVGGTRHQYSTGLAIDGSGTAVIISVMITNNTERGDHLPLDMVQTQIKSLRMHIN